MRLILAMIHQSHKMVVSPQSLVVDMSIQSLQPCLQTAQYMGEEPSAIMPKQKAKTMSSKTAAQHQLDHGQVQIFEEGKGGNPLKHIDVHVH